MHYSEIARRIVKVSSWPRGRFESTARWEMPQLYWGTSSLSQGHNKWPFSFVTPSSSINLSRIFDKMPNSITTSCQKDQCIKERKLLEFADFCDRSSTRFWVIDNLPIIRVNSSRSWKNLLSRIHCCSTIWVARADDSFVCFGAKPDKGFLDLKSRRIRKW